MKKHVLLSVISFALLLSGCDMIDTLKEASLPESISVKSSEAEYQLPAGGFSYSLAEQMDVMKIKDILENNTVSDDSFESDSATEIHVYDYNPGGESNGVMQYIIDYKLQSIPLSFNTGSDLKTSSFSEKFSAPDFGDAISNNLSIEATNFPVYETGQTASINTVAPDGLEIDFNITSPDFETMVLTSGTMNVILEAPDGVSDDFEMNVIISLTDGTNVITKSTEQNLAQGGTVVLNLAGKSLVPSMKLVVEGNVAGGTLKTNPHTYTVSMETADLQLKKITGLNMSNEELETYGVGTITVDTTFGLDGINKSLKSATIKQGSLSFACHYPAGWSGIQIIDENFQLSGGINLSNSDFVDSDEENCIIGKKTNLEDFTVTPADVTTNGSYLKISLEDAVIVFPESGVEDVEIRLAGECTIDSIGDIVIDISLLDSLADDNSIETGLSFSSIISDLFEGSETNLMDAIQFNAVDGYVFITQPLGDSESDNPDLSSLNFAGTVSASYKKDGVATEMYILGSQESSDTIYMKYSTDTFASLADEKFLITDDKLLKEHDSSSDNLYSAKISNMSQLINDKPDDLVINYSLSISDNDGEVTIPGELLDNLSAGSAYINVSIAIVIKMQLRFNDCIDDDSTDGWVSLDDVLSLFGTEMNEDLLGRDAASDSDDWKKYSDIIKEISLKYTIKNSTGFGMKGYIVDSATGINKNIDVSSGVHTITFTDDDIDAIINNYPFIPNFNLAIKASDVDDSEDCVKLTRDSEFGVSGEVSVVTDGTVELWNKNE